MSAHLLLVGAGSGERLGTGQPKAFVELAGTALLVHCLRAAEGAARIDGVTVVVGGDQLDATRQLLADHSLEVSAVCAGGPTRTGSVTRGLRAMPTGAGVVAVHDAARPLVTPGLLDRTVAALEAPWEAAAPGLPVVDTLKLVDDRRQVLETVPRRRLWGVQTPQVFFTATLRAVHDHRAAEDVTDDLELVERAGGQVLLVEGERANFKITYPEDLVIADAILGGRR